MIQALNMNPDRIEYVIWKFGKDEPEINIDGHNLVYAQLGTSHHGCQSIVSGSDKNDLITEKCRQITKLFREIEELNK